MNTVMTNNDIDEIMTWLHDYVTEKDRRIYATTIRPIKPEQRELARQVSVSHQRILNEIMTLSPPQKPGNFVEALLTPLNDWLLDFIDWEPIQMAFASDGKHNQSGLGPFNLLGGDCSLTVEYIPDDPDWKIIKVKFGEHRIQEFQGRRIAVSIAGIRYELGEVNRRGIAEGEIPGDLDLAQLDYVYYGKPTDS